MCWARFTSRPALACLCSDAKVRLWKLGDNHLPGKSPKATVLDTAIAPVQNGLIVYDPQQDMLAVAAADRLKVWVLGKKRASSCIFAPTSYQFQS